MHITSSINEQLNWQHQMVFVERAYERKKYVIIIWQEKLISTSTIPVVIVVVVGQSNTNCLRTFMIHAPEYNIFDGWWNWIMIKKMPQTKCKRMLIWLIFISMKKKTNFHNWIFDCAPPSFSTESIVLPLDSQKNMPVHSLSRVSYCAGVIHSKVCGSLLTESIFMHFQSSIQNASIEESKREP